MSPFSNRIDFAAPLMHHHASGLDHIKSWYRSFQGRYYTLLYDLAFPFYSLKFNPKLLILTSKELFHYCFKVYVVVSGSISYSLSSSFLTRKVNLRHYGYGIYEIILKSRRK